jgi:ABC-2 type transport system ATP-binding protein
MICNRVAIIVNGEIINQGALHDLISEKILFTEVILSGVEEKELEGLGEYFSGHGDRILLKVFKEENVEKALQLVQSSKGKVHSLIPRTETLEDLFVEIVKQR